MSPIVTLSSLSSLPRVLDSSIEVYHHGFGIYVSVFTSIDKTKELLFDTSTSVWICGDRVRLFNLTVQRYIVVLLMDLHLLDYSN